MSLAVLVTHTETTWEFAWCPEAYRGAAPFLASSSAPGGFEVTRSRWREIKAGFHGKWGLRQCPFGGVGKSHLPPEPRVSSLLICL